MAELGTMMLNMFSAPAFLKIVKTKDDETDFIYVSLAHVVSFIASEVDGFVASSDDDRCVRGYQRVVLYMDTGEEIRGYADMKAIDRMTGTGDEESENR